MKKLNYMALTESLNKFRMEHQLKTYRREELVEVLRTLGFNPAISSTIIAKHIPSEHVGKAKLYSFGKKPIHKGQIEALYRKRQASLSKCRQKKEEQEKILSKEENAIKILQEKGYQIRKTVRFDLERFSKENPVLYKRYLIYESV